MANESAMQAMKVLHKQANPAATVRAAPEIEARRLEKSRLLALNNAAALVVQINRAAGGTDDALVQRLTDDAQIMLAAAAGFQELIDDIPNGRQLAA
ncbi:hypothetical protein G3N18_01910 [Microbacterium sp. 2C]|uniref:hypothetical protein n=1 Tax=Microbacterium paulum TaxID=2707006 RepID=UPI0018C218BE|nr:hypothetical protein [Microbacterium paulum]MBG0716842.1 hypothetical protein [Microbacterium paulum]